MALVRGSSVVVVAVGLLSLGGCFGGGQKSGPAAYGATTGGFHLFGMGKAAVQPDDPKAAIGVNAYLWRASLDTLAFMPLSSADPYGGVIITDWYANPEKPDERFKATVYILDTRLRADGLNVTIFKQVRSAAGGWQDAATASQTETDIENAILTRARQLRLSNIR
jgi:hypothetical protein